MIAASLIPVAMLAELLLLFGVGLAVLAVWCYVTSPVYRRMRAWRRVERRTRRYQRVRDRADFERAKTAAKAAFESKRHGRW